MHKLILSTAGAFMLLLAVTLVWNSDAVAYSGLSAMAPIHSPVHKALCKDCSGNFIEDKMCGDGKQPVCEEGANGQWKCLCGACGDDGGEHASCPSNRTICCATPGQCCVCADGRFKCCPR